MNKLFNKIAIAFVGMAMAIGVGVAVEKTSDGAKEVKADDPTYEWQLVTSAPADWSGTY